jgi:hypothetical protein
VATISVMCNDSAIDFNEFKGAFEKVGEATEAALIVLAEKINPYGLDKRGGRLESAKVVRKVSRVVIDIFIDFANFRRKMAFLNKNQCSITFLQKLAVFKAKKVIIFTKFFGGNIF